MAVNSQGGEMSRNRILEFVPDSVAYMRSRALKKVNRDRKREKWMKDSKNASVVATAARSHERVRREMRSKASDR